MKKKVPIIVGTLLMLCCSFITVLFQMGDRRDKYINKFNYIINNTKTSYVTANTTTSKVVPKPDYEKEEDSSGGESGGNNQDPDMPGVGTGTAPSDWLSLCADIHDKMREQGLDYVYGGYGDFTYDGRTVSARLDCSGYTSLCFYFYGRHGAVSNMTTDNRNNTDYGCVVVDRSEMQPGDLIFYSSHIEIFAEWVDEANHVYHVYNRGGTSSALNPAPRGSGHTYDQIVLVWRVQ